MRWSERGLRLLVDTESSVYHFSTEVFVEYNLQQLLHLVTIHFGLIAEWIPIRKS